MCFMCKQNLHESCTDYSCICAMNNHTPEIKGQNEAVVVPDDFDDDDRYSRTSRESGRGSTKRDSALKDQQSTGRKRAAKAYPLNFDAPCEWQRLANCGGGTKPIVGCISGLQQARHHGPDKNVTNNEQGNVHRICHGCHYRWHAANDPEYDWNSTGTTTHSPHSCSDDELRKAAEQELKMRATKAKKIKD